MTERTNSGCLIFTGCVNSRGYGQLRIGSKADGSSRAVLTHRLAWTLRYGSIPSGLFVLHRCDVRRCVEPTHLFLGTAADNSADMVAKGRAPRGNPERPRNPITGRFDPSYAGERWDDD
jgi:hypothetical protein